LNYVIMLSVISQQREALLSISGTRVSVPALVFYLRIDTVLCILQLWSGQNAQSYNSNAIAYGALAQQMFASGKTYQMVPAALGIGCLLPIPVWLLHRRFPNFGFNNIHTYIITQYSCYMVSPHISDIINDGDGLRSQYLPLVCRCQHQCDPCRDHWYLLSVLCSKEVSPSFHQVQVGRTTRHTVINY
jgi:hypothetical protein